MKIAALVVTFNRKESLAKVLSCLLMQSRRLDGIILVDNASNDGTLAYLQENFHYVDGMISVDPVKTGVSIDYHRLKTNTGGAGGFSKALQIGRDSDYDWLWGMDDDAYPDVKALEKLMNVIDPSVEGNVYWSNCDKDLDFDGEVKTVADWMFVGFMVPTSAVRKVGVPRADFFVYFDDIEYAMRLKKSGYSIIKVKDSIIDHGNPIFLAEWSRKVGPFLFAYPKFPDWKFYYFVRNNFLILSLKERFSFKRVKGTLGLFLRVVFANPSQLPTFFEALIHGLLGVSGAKKVPQHNPIRFK